ncbi:MAG: hypothetical protein ABIH21_02255 [Patescibacteria group bacterium]
MKGPFNRHGGLTLVPTPWFLQQAQTVQKILSDPDSFTKEFHTDVDIVEPYYGGYASGEPNLEMTKEHVGGHDVMVITSGPGDYKMQGQLYQTLDYLAGHRAARISVVTSYFPCGRTDKDEGGKKFAAPHFIVRMMQTAANGKLDRIISVDLHSAQVVVAGNAGFVT